MNPPLSNHSIGNLVGVASVLASKEERGYEFHELVGKLWSAIKKIDGSYIKRIESGHEYYVDEHNRAQELFECKIGFLGKPLWVSIANMPCKNVVILMSTKRGDGIEAWLNLLGEDMAALEHGCEFASLVATSVNS
ncbi:Stemmadenine O-acetyltransferase [Camellia lanceoleosa]|uniref:Stemmadenine O-acetyltransferase n=1 Tax=Camellia lanceoleosa TaxID=1840588 RepID=A0ACC0HVJ2_9ERIC|nr:Stemmadenine O-acetyltransferase [Camellia lanceoleosa]